MVDLLVSVTVVAILAALIIPVYQRGLELSRNVKCIHNLRRIGVAMMGYINDNDGLIPSFRDGTFTVREYVGLFEKNDTLGDLAGWGGHIYPYLGGKGNWKVFICPSDPHASERDLTDYTSNGGLGTGASYSLNAGYQGAPRGVGYITPSKELTSREVRLQEVQWPSQLCLVADDTYKNRMDVRVDSPGGLLYAPWNSAVYHPQHNGGINVLYADGHVATTALSFFQIKVNPQNLDIPERRFWFIK